MLKKEKRESALLQKITKYLSIPYRREATICVTPHMKM